jgi:hypothetical protein
MPSHPLFAVRTFPSVVQAADIAALRAGGDEDAIGDFVGGYLGFDERARHALDTALQALASGRGGAFFLNGVFGSGKSHLLGLIALLCDGCGHASFLETHRHLAPLLQRFPRYFVAHFSLDEYDATRFALETIVRCEIEKEWRRRFGQALEWPQSGTRSEYFLALEEQLKARGCDALLLGIDELSLFLSAKEHRALQADAAFLQFLGQRAARSTPCPFHLFATLQKNVDDIGDLEAYSLSQIRDRFHILPLSLAHIPSLIEHRLIVYHDEAALQNLCVESYDKLHQALPYLEFGREEWRHLYPFHPATVALLEQVVARFFSRTRSAVLFCANSAREYLAAGNASHARILPDALFDYLAPELDAHPDLRPLAGVWRTWRESVPDLARDAHDAVALLRLMKTLLLFKIAGNAPTVSQLAHAAALDANLEGERNYEYTRLLLERLRTQGSSLAQERREGAWQDRYAVDHGTRVSELARRHLRSAMQELDPHDARIADCVVRCCRADPLPLATFSTDPICCVQWRNAPREIALVLWQRDAPSAQLVNRAAALGQIGTREELLLILVPPFCAPLPPLELRALPVEARWRNAVVMWTPRTPTQDEHDLAREATAAQLLAHDPLLLDNRRGRAILAHLKESAAARELQIAQLATRLFREGQFVTASGLCIEAGELALGTSWTNALEAVAECVLPQVFPHFEEIAPRLRVLTPANAQTLCLEVLRRPAADPYFAATHERLVRAIAEPLGIARAEKGRWKISPPRDDLAQELIATTRETSTFAALEAHFTSSAWGLKREQLELTICALLRCGELTALDARGQVLPPSQLGLPLARALRTLRPGTLIADETWTRLQSNLELLTSTTLGARAFPEQENARQILALWQTETTQQLELAQARLHQLQRALKASTWPRSQSTLAAMAELLAILKNGADVLSQCASWDDDQMQPIVRSWRRLHQQLETRQGALLAANALLTAADLRTPPALQTTRQELLLRLQNGESALEDEALLTDWEQWREAYATAYREWHHKQNDAARWNSLRRLANSDALRFLERLSTLRVRDFERAAALRQALHFELDKACPRDGSLLPAAAICNACGLRFGTRVLVREACELERLLCEALRDFAQMLREPPVRAFLERHEAARELLCWDGDVNALPLLSDEVLALLEAAFQPRRRVRRSLQTLAAHLGKCRTREEFQDAFARWLDEGAGLASHDEVELI